MYVIPGLWEMHVHAFFSDDTARYEVIVKVTMAEVPLPQTDNAPPKTRS